MTEYIIGGRLNAPLTTLTALGVMAALRARGESSRLHWGDEKAILTTDEGVDIADTLIWAAGVVSADLSDIPEIQYIRDNKSEKTPGKDPSSYLDSNRTVHPLGDRQFSPALMSENKEAVNALVNHLGGETQAQENLRALWKGVRQSYQEVVDRSHPLTRSVIASFGRMAYWSTAKLEKDFRTAHALSWWVMPTPEAYPKMVLKHALGVQSMSPSDVLDSLLNGNSPENYRHLSSEGNIDLDNKPWSENQAGVNFADKTADAVRVFAAMLGVSVFHTIPSVGSVSKTSSTWDARFAKDNWPRVNDKTNQSDMIAVPLPLRPVPLSFLENLIRSGDLLRTSDTKVMDRLNEQGVGGILRILRTSTGGKVANSYTLDGAVFVDQADARTTTH